MTDFELLLSLEGVGEPGDDHADLRAALQPLLAKMVEVVEGVAPMDQLDGFTFAIDYDAALREFDKTRNFGTRPLDRTDEEYAQGIAMAPRLMRDGVVKTRVIVSASVAAGMLSGDEKRSEWAIGVVLHELGHVALNGLFDRAYAGVTGAPLVNRYEAILYEYSDRAFQEYFACRVAAQADPEVGEGYREAFLGALERLATDIPSAIDEYRWHGDINVVLTLAFARVGDAMKYAGYWVGHRDGLGEEVDVTELSERLEGARFKEAFPSLLQAFRELWNTRASWQDVEEWFVFNRLLEDVLARYDIFPRRNDGGMWVDIP